MIAAAHAAPPVPVPLVEIRIDEALTLEAMPHVSACLDRVLALRPEHVVMDLAGCPLLDAAAIALLLDVHRQLWRSNGTLSLRSPSPRLRRLLQVARVDNVLNIVPDQAPSPAYSGRQARPSDRPTDAA